MKKLLFWAAAFAALLTSCNKEKPVVINHPVGVDMEGDALQKEYAVQFFDLAGSSCDGGTFKSYIDADASLLLVVAPYDRAAWFATELPGMDYFNYMMLSNEAYNLCYVIATSAHVDLKTINLNRQNVPYVILGKSRLVLSALSAVEEDELLSETYALQPEFGWLYAVRLSAASATFAKAAFTDCYKAQWGDKFLWDGRTDYLYASPGIWNNVKQIRIDRFADIPNPVYSFKVISEEDAR